MASPAPKTLRTLYRSLLRELPPRPLLSQPRAPLHQHLRSLFHDGASADTAEMRAAQATQCLAYFRAQRKYVELLERYNPGAGMDQEERVRLSARRVGMNLPVEFANGGTGAGGKT